MALDQVAPFHTTRIQRALEGELQQVPPAPTPVRKLIGNNLLVSVASGPLAGNTLNYDFNLVNFDYRTWHDYEWQNWTMVDALLNAAFRGVENLSVWQPDTDYAVGDVVVSTETGLAYECLVAHTSDSDSIMNDFPLGYWSETVVGASYTKDESDARYVNIDGDAMTGPLVVDAMFTIGNSAADGMNITYNDASSVVVNLPTPLPIFWQMGGVTRYRFDSNGAMSATTSVPTRTSGDGRWLQLSGGTMTGPLVVQTPTAAGHPTTKTYVDTLIASTVDDYLPLSGGAVTGPTSFAGTVTFTGAATFAETSFPTPNDDDDAATKKYVDDAVSGGGVSPYVKKTGDTMTGDLVMESSYPSIILHETGVASATSWFAMWTNNSATYVGARGDPDGQVNATNGGLSFHRDATGNISDIRANVVGAALPNANSIVGRSAGDARYGILSGTNTWLGMQEIKNTSPQILFIESDATAAYATTRFVRDGNSFYIQTRSDANAAVSTDYRMYIGASGVNRHSWYTNNTVSLDLTTGAFTVSKNAYFEGIIDGASSIECATGLYVNDDSSPMLTLRNAAKQNGALFYADSNANAIVRTYESFVSSNYTNYAFRYGGATSSGDVLRKADGDALYMRGPDITNTGRWTAQAFEINHTAPYLNYVETDAASGNKCFAVGLSSGTYTISPRDDSGSTISNSGAVNVIRDTTGITDMRMSTSGSTSSTALPATSSVVTRERGDARYSQATTAAGTPDSYAMLISPNTAGWNATITGSNLTPSNVNNNTTAATISGTWRCMGNATQANVATLFYRGA